MSKKTLNQANLETLGAKQLAALLMEISTGSADIKRRLRLELSHNLGVSELAHEVRKRLASLRKSVSFVGWRKRKALIKDLETQVKMITEKIAPEDANAGFDLLWQFIEIAPAIYGRVDDSKGDVSAVFHGALGHFETIAPRALLDPDTLADQTWAALQENGDGEWDGIILLLAPSLGTTGLARLAALVEAFGATPTAPTQEDHEAIQFLRQLRGGDTYAADRKARFVRETLQEIAAAAGDTHAYIAQYSDDDLQRQDIAAEVAALLLNDGQADYALGILDAADQNPSDAGYAAWNAAYVAALTGLKRVDDAQDHRWSYFAETLDRGPLRDYIKLLPDFEDIDAEERARQHVLTFPNFSAALHFCIEWPDIPAAAQLIEARSAEINGDHTALLTPAAEALRSRYPRAAMLLWRAMVNYALERDQVFRYDGAVENLISCVSVDVEIADYGPFASHDDYVHALRQRHARKQTFWDKVR